MTITDKQAMRPGIEPPAAIDRAMGATPAGAEGGGCCPSCNGSGETTALVGGGPDAYEAPVNCPKCAGAGAHGGAQ